MKMVLKRKGRLAACILVLVVVSSGMVFASDVVVKEGNIDVNDANVGGNLDVLNDVNVCGNLDVNDVNVGGNLDVVGDVNISGTVGIGVSPASSIGLYVSPTVTSTYTGASFFPCMAPASSNQILKSMQFLAQVQNSSENVTAIYGLEAKVGTPYTYTGTVSNVYGIHSSGLTQQSTGKVENWYLFYGADPFFGGNVDNMYGLYLEPITQGGTKNYAIYSAGGDSYHAGDFGINKTSPDAKLQVVGDCMFGDDTNDVIIGTTGNVSFAGSAELIIPSSTSLPATANVGSIYLDTDAGTNGTVYMYANGQWRAMVVLP